MADNKRSGWFYLFVGCGAFALLAIIGIGVVGFMAVRWGKNLKAELEDPVVREEKAREYLGTDMLPQGYHATVNLNAPLGLMRMVILSDGEAHGEAGKLDGDHMFLYLEIPGWDKDWKEFANGGPPPLDKLGEMNINLDRREQIAQGELAVDAMEVFYTVNRGEISAESFHSEEGVFSVMLVRCPDGDKRQRTAIWAGPPGESADNPVAGTTGDPTRIAEMLGHFQLCG